MVWSWNSHTIKYFPTNHQYIIYRAKKKGEHIYEFYEFYCC